ncbi:MAG: ABC transporter permease [Nocardioidaceae bacterium]
MTSAVITPKRPAAKEAQPYVEVAKNRHTLLKLGIVLAVWVVGWAIFKGQDTLARPVNDLTGFQTWLNNVRDNVQVAATNNWFFHGVIGTIVDAVNNVFLKLQELFSTPAPPRPVPEVGWLGVVAILGWIGYAVASWRAAVLVVVSVLLFGVLGYWQDSVDLLLITALAVGLCIVIGLPIGIAMARRGWVSAVVTPFLDVMQTMPSFAYLIPFVLIFSIGPACALIVTMVYAMPPLIRITEHGIRSVSPTTIEAADSIGATRRQLLRKVQLPMARRTIVLGINQCTLAALSMATIAAFVNGPGLGQPNVQALENLDIGTAAVTGLAIVVIAIMLDRTTTAASERTEQQNRGIGQSAKTRRATLVVFGVIVLIAVWASRTYLQLARFPGRFNFGSDLGHWIGSATNTVVNHIDAFTNGVKNAVSYGFLNPLQSLLAETPWWLMALVLIAISFVLGGWRPAVVTLVCEGVLLGVGLWNDAMVTLTMTLVATVLVMIIAVVLGVWMGRSRRADTVARPFLDAFQTLPPFVYLVPALALFSTSRFTAIVAAMLYGVTIATKLVADGIRGVPPTTVEAAESTGSTSWQMISKVQLPMSKAALVLATNQGLLYVLSMVVIGGLVGGGSLGYLVVAGFSQATLFGKGLAAAIAITALGVMLDRTARYAAARFGQR